MGLTSWFAGVFSKALAQDGRLSPAGVGVEALEDRKLMSAPVITSAVADNRGQVVFTFDQALNRDTVTATSMRIYSPGDDGKVNTADDVRERIRLSVGSRRVIMTARNLDANTRYRVYVRGSAITNPDGEQLDGEFNGARNDSGNGNPGGNYQFQTRVDSSPVVRFTTDLGNIDVQMLVNDAPITVNNFLRYANDGDYDSTFFHRSLTDFVIQGGGFNLDNDDIVGNVRQRSAIQNEPGVSNTRGTIAMAKLGGNPNSATNQWFFNCADNGGGQPALDTQNGGFTVFGRIVNSSGRGVMDDINELHTVDAGDAFSDLPVEDPDLELGINVNRGSDLVMVQRVAALMTIREL